MRWHQHRFIKAFTTTELIITIVIVGIMASVLTVAWPGDTMSLEAQAHQLANDMRYIQHLAITRNQRYRINFSTNQYSFTELNGTTAVNHPALGSNVVNLASGITLVTSNVPNGYLVFNGEGVPYADNSEPGTALASTASITLTASGETEIVTVTPETGMIVIS